MVGRTSTKTVIRAPHNDERPYVATSRATAQDRMLTWEARGVLWYLLSKPDDWEVQPKDLEQKCKKHVVYRVINELIERGYLARVTERDDKGRVTKMFYRVHECPFPNFQEADKQEADNQHLTYKRKREQKKETTTEPVGLVFKSYENEIGLLSAGVADEIKLLLEDTPPEWICDAIHEAALSNKRNLRYIKGILKNWRVEGRKAKQDTGTPKTPRAALPSTLPDDVLPVLFQREKEADERKALLAQNGGDHD